DRRGQRGLAGGRHRGGVGRGRRRGGPGGRPRGRDGGGGGARRSAAAGGGPYGQGEAAAIACHEALGRAKGPRCGPENSVVVSSRKGGTARGASGGAGPAGGRAAGTAVVVGRAVVPPQAATHTARARLQPLRVMKRSVGRRPRGAGRRTPWSSRAGRRGRRACLPAARGHRRSPGRP